MLTGFHALFHDLMETPVPMLALVRGQCLGGGLELAAFCDWVWVEEGARLGQPEMKLGVFAPVGSLVLPWRCRARAGDLLLSGRTVDAAEALRIGLADRLLPAGEGEAALDGWFAESLLPLSASSLRHARSAARWDLHRRLREGLPELEALYLDVLMSTHDAVEGLRAFLEKRAPSWKDA
jgi:cyclohexa-1,5-dienecarbonyl-CoA hydratase